MNKQATTPTKLDLDYFESIILYNSLTNPEYLSSIISYVDSSFFNENTMLFRCGNWLYYT